MTSEYAEIKRLEREIEKARIAAEQWETKSKQLEAEIEQTKRTNEQLKAKSKQLETEVERQRRAAKQLEAETELARVTVDQLEDENNRIKADLSRSQSEASDLRRALAQAKDPSPVKRCSLKRVQALATNACMAVQRVASGWLLKFGRLERHFRFLGQIWQILLQEDWALSDVFPSEPSKQQKALRLPFRHPVLAAKLS